VRLTETRLRQIIREELENRESLSEVGFVKSLYRGVVGQAKHAKKIDRLLTDYLTNNYGHGKTHYGLAELASQIVSSIEAFGVNYMDPEAGNVPLLDHEAFRAAFDRRIARPRDRGARRALDRLAQEGQMTLRDFIKGA